MNESERRLWGIDVIAGIYGVATLLLVWLVFNGTDAGRLAGMILAPLSAILCFGIAFRSNLVRIILLILLGVAVVGNVVLILFFLGALADVFQSPPNKDPARELMRIPIRIGGTLVMFFYLRRCDVRDAFRQNSLDTAHSNDMDSIT